MLGLGGYSRGESLDSDAPVLVEECLSTDRALPGVIAKIWKEFLRQKALSI